MSSFVSESVNKNWRVLVVGQTGSGKSTIINALHNDSVLHAELAGPAPTSAGDTGTRFSTVYYRSTKRIYQDTVGFHDENTEADVAKIIESMRGAFAETRGVTFTHVLLVVPYGRISDATKTCIALMHGLFGETFKNKLILVVTHCDVDEKDYPSFIHDNRIRVNTPDEEKDTKDEFKKLVRYLDAEKLSDPTNVKKDRIVMGSMKSTANVKKDAFPLQDRTALLARLKDVLTNNVTTIKPLERTWNEFISIVWDNVLISLGIRKESTVQFGNANLLRSETIAFASCFICNKPNRVVVSPVSTTSTTPTPASTVLDGEYSAANPAVATKCCGAICHRACPATLVTPLKCPLCNVECEVVVPPRA